MTLTYLSNRRDGRDPATLVWNRTLENLESVPLDLLNRLSLTRIRSEPLVLNEDDPYGTDRRSFFSFLFNWY